MYLTTNCVYDHKNVQVGSVTNWPPRSKYIYGSGALITFYMRLVLTIEFHDRSVHPTCHY
jgi:hypothetical protein